MSEQDGTQASTKRRRSRQASTLQRPTTNDPGAWKAYWEQQGQPWRTEPEIDLERQKYLTERRSITPNIEQGIYPFKDIELSRSDVEWLLATHENGRGPVDWSDESQRKRQGLDVRGAHLCKVELDDLPLAHIYIGLSPAEWYRATPHQRELAATHLEKAQLWGVHLEGAFGRGASMKGASLHWAHLEMANLRGAHLEEADLRKAHLEGVNLSLARLEGADLSGAFFDTVQQTLIWLYWAMKTSVLLL